MEVTVTATSLREEWLPKPLGKKHTSGMTRKRKVYRYQISEKLVTQER